MVMARHRPLAAQTLFQPGAHLRGGLVGEGDGGNLPGAGRPAPPPARRSGPPGSWSCRCRGPPPQRLPAAVEVTASSCGGFSASGWGAAGAASGAKACCSSRRGLDLRTGSVQAEQGDLPAEPGDLTGGQQGDDAVLPVKARPGAPPGPARRRRMPSATQGPAVRGDVLHGHLPQDGELRPQVHGASARTAPGYSSRRRRLRWRRRSPPAGAPDSQRAWRPRDGNPAGRSARASTRCSTPMVSFFPHTGQTPPSAAVSAGVRQTPQFRWPSRWYLPSSGKNSTVPRNPSPVRMARTSSG